MDLNKIALSIREVMEEQKEKLGLRFIEDTHTYYMKDKNGMVRDDWPSVSKILKNFYEAFPAEDIAYKMAQGDELRMQEILQEWKNKGTYATNVGSRTHFYLEKNLVDKNGNYKDVREPIFECDLEQELKSNSMIKAGDKFIKLMEERGAVLLDTEMVLGHPELGYTGQPDKVWLIMNAKQDGYGLVITDWKTNKEKNFRTNKFTKPLLPPFQEYPDTALGHYYLQLPFYARLLTKMLEGTEFENLRLLGGIIVLLKENSDFEEFRIPKPIIDTIFEMDMSDYINILNEYK